MRLIIIAEESVYEHEVDPSMEVQDVKALIEAETGVPSDQILLTTDSGSIISSGSKSLESYGLKGESSTIFLTTSPQASSSTGPGPTPSSQGASEGEYERMRLQALGNPGLMSQLRNFDPEMAHAIQTGGQTFRDAYLRQGRRNADAQAEKEKQTELLNSDPYDIEAQKKIEEAIRWERVMENMEHALNYTPETFANVTMLYVNLEVNGHPVKAFVDSGAQRTIISPDCAEKCGIMRLMDSRYSGVAVGVGSGRILGRIHSAQVKLGELFLPCSFTVLEGKGVDMLFGLDMLKKYQCSIDLSANVLRIQSTSIPFLPESELPRDFITETLGQAPDSDGKTGITTGPSALNIGAKSPIPSSGVKTEPGVAGPSKPSASGVQTSFPGSGRSIGSVPASGALGAGLGSSKGKREPEGTVDLAREGKVKEDDVQTLIGLGAERQQAIALLEASGGNVDYAASMLFGGGSSWS